MRILYYFAFLSGLYGGHWWCHGRENSNFYLLVLRQVIFEQLARLAGDERFLLFLFFASIIVFSAFPY